MKKLFVTSKLEAVVAPDSLFDVLTVLAKNGLIEGYDVDFTKDELEITIPKNVEIKEVMSGFQNVVENGKKRGQH